MDDNTCIKDSKYISDTDTPSSQVFLNRSPTSVINYSSLAYPIKCQVCEKLLETQDDVKWHME